MGLSDPERVRGVYGVNIGTGARESDLTEETTGGCGTVSVSKDFTFPVEVVLQKGLEWGVFLAGRGDTGVAYDGPGTTSYQVKDEVIRRGK